MPCYHNMKDTYGNIWEFVMDISALTILTVIAAVLAIVVWLYRLVNEAKRRKILQLEQEKVLRDEPRSTRQVVQISGGNSNYIEGSSRRDG